MVAVQVANGNVIYPHHADSTMPERDLRAFAAVQQKLLFVDIDKLGCRIAPWKRQRSAATQDVDFESQVIRRPRSADKGNAQHFPAALGHELQEIDTRRQSIHRHLFSR